MKKIRHEQQQKSTVLDPFPSSPNICSGSFDQNVSTSSPSIDETFDITLVTENSKNNPMPVDISLTCSDTS